MVLPIFCPTAEEYAQHMMRTSPVPRGESVKYSLARTDPVYFVVNQIGIRPYTWQAKMLDDMALGKSIMACTSRQVGKTAAIAWYCLWSCLYNTEPMESTKKTRMIIVSATEEQSKKIIADIKEFMRIGDEHIYNITGKLVKDKKTGEMVKSGGVENWFTNQIDKGKDAHNNTSSITFGGTKLPSAGCQIISLPPTERARGYTGSRLFRDESAFIDDEIHKSTLEPVVSRTGRTCDTSTPNGCAGHFYKNFDPNDELPEHRCERIWLPYTSLHLDDPGLVERKREQERIEAALGNERQFQQEYLASFNSATASFFDSEDVDACIDKNLDILTRYPHPCDVGVDFGINKVSRTVITITALEHEGSKRECIRLLYQKEYLPDKDLSLVSDIQDLAKHFNIQRWIFEDCPAAKDAIQQAHLIGVNLQLFNPSSEKATKYFLLRTWMKRKKVTIPYVDELIRQMKGMVQEDGARVTKIHHGAGLLDDRVDSFMMSTYFFTEEHSNFKVWDVDEV